MTVKLTMRGLLEPIELEDNFDEAVNQLNNSAAQGKEFVVTRKNTGEHLIIKMGNILTLEQIDDEDEFPSAF
jgi:hypothetical protein